MTRITKTIDCYYCGQRFYVGDPAADSHWCNCVEHPARAVLDLAAVVKEYVTDIQMAAAILDDTQKFKLETLDQCAESLRALARRIEELT